MNLKHTITVAVFCLSALAMPAQKLKVVSDTSKMECKVPHQPCVINYVVHLSPYSKDIVFNYMYINGLRQNLNQPNELLGADTVSNTYTIRTSKSAILIGPCQHYSGEALISYTSKGKTDTIIIQHFVCAKPNDHVQ